MARPREFEESAVLDEAVECFWREGYEATSMRDLIGKTGLTGASLYNAFGDKRALFERALEHYVEHSISERIQRCAKLSGREAIETFFSEILSRSLADPDHKGCMLVNTAIDTPLHDLNLQLSVRQVLERLEDFFLGSIERGREDGTVISAVPTAQLAQHLLGVLMGVRVLARVRPEEALLKGVIDTALVQLGERR